VALVAFILLSVALLVGSAYASARWGWIPPAASMAAAVALAAIVGADVAKLAEVAAPVVIGSAAGCSLKYGRSKQFFLIVSACVLAALFSATYYSLTLHRNIDVLAESKRVFKEMVASSGMAESDKKEFFERFDEYAAVAVETIPFVHFLYGLLLSAVGVVIIRMALKRVIGDTDALSQGLEYFALNDYAIFALIATWLVVLLVDSKEQLVIHRIGLNGALIVSMLYVLQALGVIKFLLLKRNVPVFLLPLTLGIVAVAGAPFLLFVLVILVSLGSLDVWVDFRKLRPSQAP